MDETLVGRLMRHARERPSHEAVVTPRVRLSYAELGARVAAQARRLRDAGVSRGSVVGIACPDEVQHLLLNLAAAAIGAASCTVPAHASDRQRQDLSERCGVTHDLGPATALAPDEPAAGAIHDLSDTVGEAAVLFATSGTTGEPKIVRLR